MSIAGRCTAPKKQEFTNTVVVFFNATTALGWAILKPLPTKPDFFYVCAIFF